MIVQGAGKAALAGANGGGCLLCGDLDAKTSAAPAAAAGEYLTSAQGRHAGPKAVGALTANVVRLVCTLHSESPSVLASIDDESARSSKAIYVDLETGRHVWYQLVTRAVKILTAAEGDGAAGLMAK